MNDSSKSSKIEIAGLKCQSAISPVGVDTTTPKFSWLVESRERGQRQTAYQILATWGMGAADFSLSAEDIELLRREFPGRQFKSDMLPLK